MVLGTASGLAAYFVVGWYTAALTGATVSMICVIVGSKVWPVPFEWSRLAELRAPEEAEA